MADRHRSEELFNYHVVQFCHLEAAIYLSHHLLLRLHVFHAHKNRADATILLVYLLRTGPLVDPDHLAHPRFCLQAIRLAASCMM